MASSLTGTTPASSTRTVTKKYMLNMLPGPTFVPASVMSAMLDSNIYHRSEEFHRFFHALQEDLRHVFRTKRNVFAVSSSGTGGLESVVSNITRPGDRTLAIVNGHFSQELCSIVEAFRGKPIRLDFNWNSGISLDVVESALRKDKDIRAVGVAYVETSTGARAPLKELAELCDRHDKILLVDAESAIGGEEFYMDDWKIGACVAGTQKCICSPPGLALVCLGQRGGEAIERNGRTGFYFDLHRYTEYAKKDETPFTPALPQLYALQASLGLVKEEGLEEYIARHGNCGRLLRDGLHDLGLQPYVPLEYASNVATAIDISTKGITASEIVRRMKEEHGISIATGIGPSKEEIIRIGTMGTVKTDDVRVTLAALKQVLSK